MMDLVEIAVLMTIGFVGLIVFGAVVLLMPNLDIFEE